MPPNTTPNFTDNGNVSSIPVTAGNTSSEGGGTIGTSMFLAFTAGANGSYVDFLRWFATASTAATSTTATIGRIFICSITTGSPTSANCYCIGEIALPSVSADSSSAALNPIDIPLGFRLPAGWAILVTNHVAPAANSQWIATVFGGDY